MLGIEPEEIMERRLQQKEMADNQERENNFGQVNFVPRRRRLPHRLLAKHAARGEICNSLHAKTMCGMGNKKTNEHDDYNKSLQHQARELRKNMTRTEACLWKCGKHLLPEEVKI
jgi:hypothetical protein